MFGVKAWIAFNWLRNSNHDGTVVIERREFLNYFIKY